MRSLPTILISTFGSKKSGLGHVSRDAELAKLLQPEARIFFHTRSNEKICGLIMARVQARIFRGSLADAIKKSAANLLIVDRPYDIGRVEELCGVDNLKIIAFDYFYYDDGRIDIAINLLNHYIDRAKKIKIKKIYSGLKYAIIRSDVLRLRSRQGITSKSVRRVFICFGGADPNNNTLQALRLLGHLKVKRAKFDVVIGPVFRHISKIKEAGSRLFKKRITLYKNPLNFASLMARADVVICGGGVTLMEALCLGKPTTVMPQKNEINFILKKGISKAVLLLPQELSDEEKYKRMGDLLVNSRYRSKLVKISKKLIDGKGKERIKGIILGKRND